VVRRPGSVVRVSMNQLPPHDRIISLIDEKDQLVRKLFNLLSLPYYSCYLLTLIVITGRHIRAARALLGWAQYELSKRSKVALGTVRRMEGFDGPVSARTESLNSVVATLERVGVEFLNDDGPGVRLRPTKK
jgi:hypothetical protein